jgi:hypothetical protein
MVIKIVGTYLTPDQVRKMKPAIRVVDSKGKGDKASGSKGERSFGRPRDVLAHSSFDKTI